MFGRPSGGVSHHYPCCTTCRYCRQHIKDGYDDHLESCKVEHERQELERATALVKSTKKPSRSKR